MPHARQKLIDAVEVRVTGLPTTGVNVFPERPRAHPMQLSELPGIRIYDDGDDASKVTLARPTKYQRVNRLRLELCSKLATGVGAQQRTMALEVETALATVLVIDGRKVQCIYLGSRVEDSGEADQKVSVLTLDYEAVFLTAANAPDVLVGS